MKKQKKSQTGITLIALVISIIVMLILAGVSLNAMVGDNGILTQARNAAELSKKTNIIEQIEEELAGYNISMITDDNRIAAKTAIDNLIRDGIIDTVMANDGTFTTDTSKMAAIPITAEDGSWTGEFEYVVGKENYAFNIFQNGDGTFTAEISDIVAGSMASGGEVTGGKTLVTKETFTAGDSETTDDNEKGKYTIVGDASVIFADELEGAYSIYVKSGANATVSIFYSMTLSNANLQRSAIDIEPGGTLNLWIADGATVTVNSGYGGYSVPATSTNFLSSEGVIGGNGAFAGIHVPHYDAGTMIKRVVITESGEISRSDGVHADFTYTNYGAGDATLNLSGKGTLIAYGGDAGDGGNGGYNNLDWAAGAGGGAGAGIGGNGGNGATSLHEHHGEKGEKGEDCGNINISNSLTVYAYGGSGGTGGGNTRPSGDQFQSGGGGGGYPGAGIGGGGAGGACGDTHVAGAGFSSPVPEGTFADPGGVNGLYLDRAMSTVGGAYYASFANSEYASTNQKILFPYRDCIECGNRYGYSGGIGGGCGIQSNLSAGWHTNQAYVDLMLSTGNWPDGGDGGKGGTIKVSQNATVKGYNGSYITTKDSSSMTIDERQNTQALIYAQAGYDVKAIRELCEVKIVNARTIADLVSEWSTEDNNYSSYRTIRSPYDSTCGTLSGTYVLGIGSGAGSAQVTNGNGTYTIDTSLN